MDPRPPLSELAPHLSLAQGPQSHEWVSDAASSPLLQALVARFLDPEAVRAHVDAPASKTWPRR